MADRYWVGGTASWDGTVGTKWATTSGGGGGSSIPTSADNAIFDAASGAVTVTIASGNTGCLDLIATNFTGTIAGSSSLNITGSLTLGASITLTHTGSLTFSATDARTITTNGKILPNVFIIFDSGGSGGGSWVLQDNFDATSAPALVFIRTGTTDTNGKIFSFGGIVFDNSFLTSVLTLGSSTVNVTSGGQAWNCANPLGFTLNAGTSTINFTVSNSYSLFLGSRTYNNVVLTSYGGGIAGSLTGANTFANLTITKNSNLDIGELQLSANQTVTGTFTATGFSTSARVLVSSDTIGTARTITAAAVSLTNCDFMDITGAGAATWTGTSIGDAQGNTGITFTTPVTRYAVVAGSWSSTATWSNSSGGSGGSTIPLCHDTVFLDAASAAGTYTANYPRIGKNVDCTGFTRTSTISVTVYVYNNLTYSSSATHNSSNTINFMGRGSHTITTANKSFGNIILNSGVGDYTLIGNLTCGSFTISTGTFSSSSYNVTSSQSFTMNGGTLNMGSGDWIINTSGTAWLINSGTVNCGTSTVRLNNSNSTFSGGSNTYNNIYLIGGSSSHIVFGSNTFNVFQVGLAPTTVNFAPGAVNTISDFRVHGNCNSKVTIGATASSTTTLTKSGGGIIAYPDSLTISWVTATPTNTWYAGANSTDGGNNSGWIFANAPLTRKTSIAMF